MISAILVGNLFLRGCEPTPKAPPPVKTQEVTVFVIQQEPVLLTTELPGRTSAFLVAEIRPQVNGLIQERLFTEGAEVAAGQVLYQIDPAPFQAVLDNAQANHIAMQKTTDQARAALMASIAGVECQKATLKLAKTNRDRYEKLFKEKSVTAFLRDQSVTETEVAEASLRVAEAQVESNRQAVAAAKAAIQQAEAAIKTAQINFSYTKITAPISGRIGKSNVTQGALATAYQPTALATIQQIDPIYVDVPQSTTELLRLRRKLEGGQLNQNGVAQQQIQLLLEDGTPYSKEGTLQFRDITVDPTTGSFILRIVLPNPDGILLPGMFVRAILKEGVNEKAILVPQQAITQDPKGNPTVLVVDEESKIQQRAISLGRAIGNKWLVESGLASGDSVVIEGKQKVRSGNFVKVVSPEDSQKETTKSDTTPQQAAKTN